MNPTELQEISNDICVAANSKFSEKNIRVDYKWTLLNEKDNGKEMTLTEIDEMDIAIVHTIHDLKDYPAYIKLREYIENIDSVQTMLSINSDCYWTQPEQLVTKLMEKAFSSSGRYFDSIQLLNELDRLIVIIASGCHEINLAGRLHGIKLETDLIEIDSDILLVRLDKEAINQRQLTVTSSFNGILDYSDSNVEIRIKDECPIATSKKTYWQELEDIKSKLNLKLESVVKAIKLYRHGRFQVYPVLHHSSLTDRVGGFSPLEPMFISDKVVLNETDIDGLKKSFSVVKIISQDNVLKRSFSRFLIGLDERIPEEQLVDFVIAWESILQTVNGTSNKSELVYRFSLNGAAILCAVDNTREFTKTQTFMKETYNIRSTIVHGGDSNEINKILKKIGFDNLIALNNELAELYRKVIFWLSPLTKEELPYHKAFGWELLLRK